MADLETVRGAAPGAARGDEGRHDRGGGGAEVAPVTLVQFAPVWGRNVSPFSLKLETWLKLADIPYEIRPARGLRGAPKGKLPYIVEADGTKIGDSTLIIEHLKATRGIDPDAGLGPRERAEATALQRLFEDHLYFIIAYSRWVDDDGWPLTADAFFGSVPQPARRLAQTFFRERVRRMLYLQGLGRHDQRELYEVLARADLEAVAAYLDEKPFFMGERITTVDAVAYGFLANILLVPLETGLKRVAQEYPSLAAWCEAMEQGLSSGEG
jgi:glutathione S-transferase